MNKGFLAFIGLVAAIVVAVVVYQTYDDTDTAPGPVDTTAVNEDAGASQTPVADETADATGSGETTATDAAATENTAADDTPVPVLSETGDVDTAELSTADGPETPETIEPAPETASADAPPDVAADVAGTAEGPTATQFGDETDAANLAPPSDAAEADTTAAAGTELAPDPDEATATSEDTADTSASAPADTAAAIAATAQTPLETGPAVAPAGEALASIQQTDGAMTEDAATSDIVEQDIAADATTTPVDEARTADDGAIEESATSEALAGDGTTGQANPDVAAAEDQPATADVEIAVSETADPDASMDGMPADPSGVGVAAADDQASSAGAQGDVAVTGTAPADEAVVESTDGDDNAEVAVSDLPAQDDGTENALAASSTTIAQTLVDEAVGAETDSAPDTVASDQAGVGSAIQTTVEAVEDTADASLETATAASDQAGVGSAIQTTVEAVEDTADASVEIATAVIEDTSESFTQPAEIVETTVQTELADIADAASTAVDEAAAPTDSDTGPLAESTAQVTGTTAQIVETTDLQTPDVPIGDVALLDPLPEGPVKPDDTAAAETESTAVEAAGTDETASAPATGDTSLAGEEAAPDDGAIEMASADLLDAPSNSATVSPDSATARPADERVTPERSIGPDRPNQSGGPTFDVIRVGGDGRMILAGKSEALAQIIIMDGDVVLGEEIANTRGEWIFMPTDALSAGNHQIGATQRLPNGNLLLSSDLVLVVVPERGQDIAGRENDRADQPLVMLVPRDGGPATVVVQAPEPDAPLDPATNGTEVAAADDAALDDDSSGPVLFSRPSLPDADDSGESATRTSADTDGADLSGEDEASAEASAIAGDEVALAETADVTEPFDTQSNDGGDTAAGEDGADGPIAFTRPTISTTGDASGGNGADSDVNVGVIDYDDQGEMTFSGDAPAGATVQVYLDNEVLGVTEAAPSGAWQLAPTQAVPPGPHQIRVDQISPTGDVIARIELPFVRAAAVTDMPQDIYVVVEPGQSLWRIARRVYGEGIRYTEILSANKAQIADPNLIYPGQVFMIPRG